MIKRISEGGGLIGGWVYTPEFTILALAEKKKKKTGKTDLLE